MALLPILSSYFLLFDFSRVITALFIVQSNLYLCHFDQSSSILSLYPSYLLIGCPTQTEYLPIYNSRWVGLLVKEGICVFKLRCLLCKFLFFGSFPARRHWDRPRTRKLRLYISSGLEPSQNSLRELENTASKMNIWQYLRSLLPIDLSLCKHKDGSAWWMEVFKILTVFF